MKTALVCLLAGLTGPIQEPRPAPAYPTFEPFVAQPMFERFGDPRTARLDRLLRQLEEVVQAEEEDERFEEEAPEPASTRSAWLEPVLSEKERMLASLIPLVFLRLEPLWARATWSVDDVADARTAAEILARFPEPPAAVFAPGKDAENHAALVELVRWFRERVREPEWYAAMLFTLDDGPFVGLPHETSELLPATSTIVLDERTTLALCRVEREHEPWVLQARRAGKPLWTRVLSAAPDESVSEASFLQRHPERVGPYGWQVNLLVTWAQGSQHAEVFLEPDGALLFYFLSW